MRNSADDGGAARSSTLSQPGLPITAVLGLYPL